MYDYERIKKAAETPAIPPRRSERKADGPPAELLEVLERIANGIGGSPRRQAREALAKVRGK